MDRRPHHDSPGLLVAGDNVVTLRNLADAANFSSPPYVLLSVATATSSESGIFGPADDLDVEIEVLDFSLGSG